MNGLILGRVQQTLSDVFSVPLDRITLSTSPETVEAWDSLNHLNVVLALEEEFAVQFTPEEIEQLLSVDHIVTLLDQKLRIAQRAS